MRVEEKNDRKSEDIIKETIDCEAIEYRTSFNGKPNRKSLWKRENRQSAISAAEITSTMNGEKLC